MNNFFSHGTRNCDNKSLFVVVQYVPMAYDQSELNFCMKIKKMDHKKKTQRRQQQQGKNEEKFMSIIKHKPISYYMYV